METSRGSFLGKKMKIVEAFLCEESEFFAPVSSDLIDSLVGQYDSMKTRIEQVAEMVTGETAGAISYFLDGNKTQDRYTPSVDQLFKLDGAVAALNSAYWSKAMHLTDVLNYMPQKRRDEWHASIRDQTCPAFEEGTVRDTLTGLLNMRSQFLAERVDGIFRGLSGDHVTNSPAAFGKRMIVSNVLNEFWSEQYNKCGLINDLRCVIAKFMGRDEPGYQSSGALIRTLKGRWGEWVSIDGNALKIRLYKKGTAHIEVHPDMAWRLNSTLANMYPMAIPPEFRQKPAKKAKEIDLIQRPLPFAVLEILSRLDRAKLVEKTNDHRKPYKSTPIPNTIGFSIGDSDKHARAEVARILESIGGVKTNDYYQFDYDPSVIIEDIVASGCIPDQKSHQFYPTPASLAARVVELADIGPDHTCLEPSAGVGGIASFLPVDRTKCVEVSGLHCKVLESKGYKTAWNDFLPWAEGRYSEGKSFDRVVMNPPFDRGQWQSHVLAAGRMVKPGGRLVAILPASAKKKDVLPGFDCEWHGPFDNEFAGTSISVVVLVGDKK